MYTPRFIHNGTKKLFTNPFIFLLALSYVAIVAAVFYALRFQSSMFAGLFTFMYRFAFIFVALILATILLSFIGAPREFVKITQRLERVSGLYNADGESAILVSRQALNDGKTEKWIFDTYGLPLQLFEDLRDAIENALDIAIIRIEGGDDGHKIMLTVLPHPGPWPQMVPWDDAKLLKGAQLLLGENRSEQVVWNLSERAHLMVSGQTGSGKTVLLQSLMYQLLKNDHIVVLVDYKRGVDYGTVWESHCELITEDQDFLKALHVLSDELDQRFSLLSTSGCANIDQYNAMYSCCIPHIVLVVDELAECLDKTGASKERKEIIDTISGHLSRLCRLGRAAGINCILSTQRGSSDYLSGQIRNNCYKVIGRCDDNLSLLTIGCTDAARKILYRGQFMDEHKDLFQVCYADYNSLLGQEQTSDRA